MGSGRPGGFGDTAVRQRGLISGNGGGTLCRSAVHGSLGGTETFVRLTGAVATVVLEHKIGLVHVRVRRSKIGSRSLTCRFRRPGGTG